MGAGDYLCKMNISYIAGFTDGEGNISICGRGPRITWGQKHGGVLNDIAAFLECIGIKVNRSKLAPKPPKRPNEINILFISKRRHCEKLLRLMLPELIVKRADAEKVLKWLQDNPASKNMDPVPMGDMIRLLNQGYSTSRIAKELGYSVSTIWTFAGRNNIAFKSRKGSVFIDGIRKSAMTPAERSLKRRSVEKSNHCDKCSALVYKPHKKCRSCAQRQRHQKRQEVLPL
jgi:hypothetical protein